jgi:hypothetical protein
MNGWDVKIFSKKRRSEMFGAQYLHRPILGLIEPEAEMLLRYKMKGRLEDYRGKVYGDNGNGPESDFEVSPMTFGKPHRVWDIRSAYYAAWNLYSDLIVDVPNIGPDFLGVAVFADGPPANDALDVSKFDLIVSTIPAPSLCYRPESHFFKSQKVWAIGDAPERGIFCPVKTPDFTVIYDATRDTGWYRASNVFGYRTAEWPEDRKPPLQTASEVIKPIKTSCDCFLNPKDHGFRLVRAGRYGEWKKGILAHHAFEKIEEIAK